MRTIYLFNKTNQMTLQRTTKRSEINEYMDNNKNIDIEEIENFNYELKKVLKSLINLIDKYPKINNVKLNSETSLHKYTIKVKQIKN